MKLSRYDPVELKFLAEKYLERGDYENAARFFRYLMVHFKMANDESYRKFAIKAGECYMRAAERLKDPAKAITLYLRAARAFREGGCIEMISPCSSKIWESYIMLRENRVERDSKILHTFKVAGDYFMENGNFKKASIIYHDIAECALKGGRLLLAGGFYRDAGICYQRINNLDKAADLYIKAADLYFNCQEYFEAAWNYCRAGFLLIYLNRFKEASEAAEKSELACHKGDIWIFLRNLSHICKLLTQGLIRKAEDEWKEIRWKLNREYAQLIENSFQVAKMK